MRQKRIVAIILALLLMSYSLCACGNLGSIGTVPLSEDLVIKETSSSGVVNYYIYDDDGNQEYSLYADENPDMSTYMVGSTTYEDGREILHQSVVFIDYGENNEKYGLKDETTYDYFLYDYDEAGRKSHIHGVTFRYDEYFEYNDKDQLIENKVVGNDGSSHTISIEYDKDGKKIKEVTTFSENNNEFTDEFEYDSAGKMIKDGKYTCEYDDSGHMVKKYNSDLSWTYEYATNPEDNKKYLNKVNEIIRVEELEEKAKEILSEQHADTNNGPKTSIETNSKKEEQEVLRDDDFVEGGLPEAAFNEIKGHYEDGHSDFLDVESPTRMVRIIAGGNETHTYEEEICGYAQMPNGYIIYVEWDGEQYAYYYYKELGQQKLSVNFDDGWKPEFTHFTDDLQLYIKQGTDNSTQETQVDAGDPWDMDKYDGSYEDGMPEEVFEHIKGIYANSDKSIEILSPYEMSYTFSDEQQLFVYGCEAIGEKLIFFVEGERYKNMIVVEYQSDSDSLKLGLGPGHWRIDEWERDNFKTFENPLKKK